MNFPPQISDEISRRVTAALAKPRWKPAEPALLALLDERNVDSDRSLVRVGIWAAVLSYMIYGIFDWFLFPDVGFQVVLTRAVLGAFFLILLEICVRTGATMATLHLVAALAIVCGGLGWLLAAIATEHQLSLAVFMVFGTIFVLGANLFFNFRLWLSALSSTVVTVAFMAAAMFIVDVSFGIKLVIALYFANTLVLSLYLSWRLSVARYRSFLHYLHALSQEQAAIEKGQKLNEMAYTDPLTGLKNRRAIAQEFLRLSQEYASHGYEVGLILIDVDFFKRFNDRLGHQRGDECLIDLAGVLEETAASHQGIAARYGGEEFVVLCLTSGPDHLAEIASGFCEAVEKLGIAHPDRNDHRDIVTISAGASMTRADNGLDFRLLLQEADRALYMSKFSGRAKATVYDPATVEEDRASENLAELLSTAIAENRLYIAYQPLFETSPERPFGYEALLRLRDRNGATIAPTIFIPVAEHTGLISKLGAWVIAKVCSDLRIRDPGTVIAVNVSAVQLKDPGFALQVASILQKHNVPARAFALEITESMSVARDATATRNLEHLRTLGVQLWLDDFGAGYAGLAWLRHFRFDLVKIDRSFLHDCDGHQGVQMLQDMVRLLRNQGHSVLVEGVETEEQKRLVQRLGVHSMQGFHLGRPAAIENVHTAGAATAKAVG